MNNQSTISILGCGWLGLPLAQTLQQQGYQVKGSTTRPEKLSLLEERGIVPYLIHFSPEINDDYDKGFFDSEILLVNIPPKRHSGEAGRYPHQIVSLLKLVQASTIQKILFISSTSVYPDVNRRVVESDTSYEVKASGQSLLTAEQMIQDAPPASTVLRFGGLFGPDRNPGRFLAGKTLGSSGNVPVNMIHLDDCIGIIEQVLTQNVWGEVFNACAEQHPTKEDFYGTAAQRFGFTPPQFAAVEEDRYKVVDSTKLRERLGYRFKYPDPILAL